MATYDVTQAPYNAKSNYNPAGGSPPTWNTNNTPLIAQAISDAIAAGGGTVYIPGGGSGYLLENTGSLTNSIFPVISGAGVRIVGDALGRGGSKLVVNSNKDVFRIGYGDGNNGWPGLPTPPALQHDGYEISGLTIEPKKGFYGTTGAVFHVFNAVGADIHHFNINDYGFQYGQIPTGGGGFLTCTFAIDSGTGFPYAALPRPGVTTDPRGAGYQSADMGRLYKGTLMHGNQVYKNMIRDGQINGTVIGCEVGVYNTHTDVPQGCEHKNVVVFRQHTAACVQYSGDGSNGWTEMSIGQVNGPGFWYIIPANAPTGVGYGMSIGRCGIDWIGGHCVHIDGSLGGTQKCALGMSDTYCAGAGVAESNFANYPTPQTKKGLLIDNNRCSELTLLRNRIILNGGDGAEISCTTQGTLWDNTIAWNAMNLSPGTGSALYINNNSLGLNIQRNIFRGGAFGGFPNNQGYGMYVNNTNITIDVYNCNAAVDNVTAQTNLGGMGVPVPGIAVGNLP